MTAKEHPALKWQVWGGPGVSPPHLQNTGLGQTQVTSSHTTAGSSGVWRGPLGALKLVPMATGKTEWRGQGAGERVLHSRSSLGHQLGSLNPQTTFRGARPGAHSPPHPLSFLSCHGPFLENGSRNEMLEKHNYFRGTATWIAGDTGDKDVGMAQEVQNQSPKCISCIWCCC